MFLRHCHWDQVLSLKLLAMITRPIGKMLEASIVWFRKKYIVVQLVSHVRLFAFSGIAACQAFLSFTISWVCSNLCPFSQWCHPNISSSFSSCLQSFPASSSFLRSWLSPSGGQSIGASASVLPMNIQGLFPLEWTVLISLQFKGLSRVFSRTTIWRHQFFGAQHSLCSNSPIHTWLSEPLLAKWCLCFLIHSLGLPYLFFWQASTF